VPRLGGRQGSRSWQPQAARAGGSLAAGGPGAHGAGNAGGKGGAGGRTWRTRSTTDTLGVGTRRAMPLSLPFMLGSTRATAWAAPVEVGTMFRAAARARRRSLQKWGGGGGAGAAWEEGWRASEGGWGGGGSSCSCGWRQGQVPRCAPRPTCARRPGCAGRRCKSGWWSSWPSRCRTSRPAP
jgi:hypothetical protein